MTAAPPARLAPALAKIERIFGAKSQQVPAKEVKQLRAQLEQVLGERASWNTPLLRQLFDALWLRARARRRSPEHERLWLNLAGYCLRPGFGFALDEWRLQQLWTLFDAGVAHGADKQVQAEWWTLWRRVAGGLDAAQQRRLLDDFAFNLQRNEQGDDGDGGTVVRGSDDDMLRLGASLERIPAEYKDGDRRVAAGRAWAAPTTPSPCGRWAGSARASPSTAISTTWCRPTSSPPGWMRSWRWTGAASSRPASPPPTWRA